MRDRLSSYDHYQCAQSICGAHVVRDCVYVCEQEEQAWAEEMADLRLRMAKAADEWRERGAQLVQASERDAWVAQSFDLLAIGFAAQPAPTAEDVPKRGGRRKQSAAKNLLDELLRRAEQALAFLDDLSIPFTTNQAERDLRMIKVQQKIAGTFRESRTARRLSVTFAAICPPCASKAMPCWRPSRPSLLLNPCPSPGKSEEGCTNA